MQGIKIYTILAFSLISGSIFAQTEIRLQLMQVMLNLQRKK